MKRAAIFLYLVTVGWFVFSISRVEGSPQKENKEPLQMDQPVQSGKELLTTIEFREENRTQNRPYYTLDNGYNIPAFGLGTYAGDRLEEVVKTGIDMGYRLFDTASDYVNEDAIGRALKITFQKDKVKRKDLFIVTKLSNTKHKPTDVLPSIEESLRRLQLNYLDLYLMNWPFAQKPGPEKHKILNNAEDTSVNLEDTWRAMEELVKSGHTRSIGVSNFNSEQIKIILKIATIRPVVNQVECNPYLSQEKLRKFCEERNILIMAYSPLYAPARSESHDLNLFKELILEELAQRYQKTIAQIVLRYLVQCHVIPIPKTDKLDRLKSNFDIWDFAIVPEDFQKIRSLNKNRRLVDFPKAVNFQEYPFNIEF